MGDPNKPKLRSVGSGSGERVGERVNQGAGIEADDGQADGVAREGTAGNQEAAAADVPATANAPPTAGAHATAGAQATDGAQATGKLRAAAARRGIYLLPNVITTGALFAGFYATIAGMNGQFGAAGLAIFAAIVLDTADGRVARMTRTQSNFGAEYDSLSDMVAFGVAPALVAFHWGLSNLGQIGWVVTFTYIACAALRLARFNTNGDLASFLGLPSPAAAAVIACTVWVWEAYAVGEPTFLAASMLGLITIAVAMLMVSNLTYFSPKQLDLKGRVPFVTMVLVVLAFAVLLVDPPSILLALSCIYALSAPVQFVWRWSRERNRTDL